MHIRQFICTVIVAWASSPAQAATEFVNTLIIPGNEQDLSIADNGVAPHRLGGFMSDLSYDRTRNVYFGITDRGPGGGEYQYVPRIQQYQVQVDPITAAVAGFQLQKTILFKTADGSASFDGRTPLALHSNSAELGLSFDPEALVVAPNHHFFVADEYGPSLYEFAPLVANDATEARFVRAFNVPARLFPVDSFGARNYVAERETAPSLISGRQDNRGFEGLAMSPDGSMLFAVMQDPLAEEGAGNQGRRSRNVRIVRFDVATGDATGQFIYQLEDIAAINARIPQTANDFTTNQQGRQIGVSAMVAVNDHTLLVLERDTRGVNPETILSNDPVALTVGTKRLYEIDLAGASDVSNISLAGTNNLPATLQPVAKSLVADIQASLTAGGQLIPERMEGLAVGPQLADGTYSLLVGTDNDFSIAAVSGSLVDVYTDGTFGPIDGDPGTRSLFPSRIYAFRSSLPDFVAPVPEPSGWVLAILAAAPVVWQLGKNARSKATARRRAQSSPIHDK